MIESHTLTPDTNSLCFYDTNYLIDNYKSITKPFIIAQTTLTELENIKVSAKKDRDVKARARKVVNFLKNNIELFKVVPIDNEVLKIIKRRNLEIDSPDNRICAAAVLYQKKNKTHIKFYTSDISCSLIARDIFGLDVEIFDTAKEDIYKGYKLFKGNSADIIDYMGDPKAAGFVPNEYLIMYNTDLDDVSEMRFDGNGFIPLKLPNSNVIKGKNSLQRCALDMLNNPDIPINVILGTFGSGKTFLATKVGIHEIKKKGNYSKLVGVRTPVGEGAAVGYLPGGLDEKINDFFLPIAQQLDMGIIEYEQLRQEGVIEVTIPYYLKGQTFPATYMIVDEAEDLTQKELKLIGTRIGEDSKIVLCGDYKQSIIDTSDNNAVIDLCRQLKGNPLFGCIFLDEDVRSETSKVFADLWGN